MAFGGTAVVQQVSDRIVRITGLTLSGDGTIGLFGATGTTPGVRLPDSFRPEPYGYQGEQVELQDSISVEVVPAEAATGDFTIPVSVVKTGTTAATFRATLNNANASESPGLEIYVRFHE